MKHKKQFVTVRHARRKLGTLFKCNHPPFTRYAALPVRGEFPTTFHLSALAARRAILIQSTP